MHGPVGFDGSGGSYQRLTCDLPSEDPLAFLVGVDPPEDVDFDRFEIKKGNKGIDRGLLHAFMMPPNDACETVS